MLCQRNPISRKAPYTRFTVPFPHPFPSLPFLGLPYYHFLGTSYFF